MQDKLTVIAERLQKVVYVEPKGPRQDGIQVLLNDARWLAQQLQAALNEIERLNTPNEVA